MRNALFLLGGLLLCACGPAKEEPVQDSGLGGKASAPPGNSEANGPNPNAPGPDAKPTADSEAGQAPWLDFLLQSVQASCEYDVEIRWVRVKTERVPSDKRGDAEDRAEEERRWAATQILDQYLQGIGESEVDFGRLAAQMDELWEVRLYDPRYEQPGRYHVTKSSTRRLQFCLTEPSSHHLRTPELSISYQNPPGQLFVEKLDERVALYEPAHFLRPLPTGKAILAAYKQRSWNTMGRRWDCERSADPASSLTVVLDERDRPVACWDLGGAYPESLYAGFFEWSPAKGQEHFLAQAIILEQAGDEIYGVMYRITQLRLGEPSTEPVLVVPVVHRWVDSRESQPKIAEGGLPAGLEGLVRISEE